MEQTKALNALEPFLALSKSATSPRAAADLITQATSNAHTYVFAELLQAPQIQALSQASPEHAAYLRLLEIFSYGTYETYTTSASTSDTSTTTTTTTAPLPTLNDAQALKLRQLTLLALARDPRKLGYAALQGALGLPDARALEGLVVSAVYAGLLQAQLDPRGQAVRVSSVSPLRDLAPGGAPAALAQLRAWSGRCSDTLADLEAQVAAVRAEAAARHAGRRAREARQAKLVEDAGKGGGGGGGGGSGSGDQQAGQPLLLQAQGGGGGQGGVHGRRQGHILNHAMARFQGSQQQQQQQQRYGSKRSGVEANVGEDDDDDYDDNDELMELDDDEYEDGNGAEAAAGSGSGSGGGGGGSRGGKRTSRRKL